MAKYCRNCNKEWPEEFRACPMCGSLLEEKQSGKGDAVNLNLGDANAINGGINISDTHAVDSHDIHNTDSHNVHNETHNTWVTQQERQKTAEEIRELKEKEFRRLVREAYEDGRLSFEEREGVKRKEMDLGIDHKAAESIIAEEQSLVGRRVRDRNLNNSEYLLIKAVQSSIQEDDKAGLNEYIDDLELVNARIDNGEIQFFYYMLLAAITPNEFVKKAIEDKLGVDCFWRTVWLAMACKVIGRKRSIAFDSKYHEYMEDSSDQFPGNIELAESLSCVKDACMSKIRIKSDALKSIALSHFKKYESDHQPFLEDLGNAIDAIINSKPCPEGSRFYLESFFPEAAQEFAAAMKAKQEEDELFAPLDYIPELPKISPLDD